MRFLLIFLIVAPAWAGFDRVLNINSLTPKSDTFEGISFPRNDQVLYRGNPEAQLSRTEAIRAMLGEDRPVESVLFSGVKLMLMKQAVPFLHYIKPILSSRNLDTEVSNLLAANGHNPYSLKKARELTYKMLEKDLLQKLLDKSFIDQYVDYRSAKLLIFPQDVVFSTTYLEVANIYSRFITLLSDRNRTMLDLNYWNYVRNSAWSLTFKKWIDKGEFIAPVAIEGDSIEGFMEFETQGSNLAPYREPKDLDLAFMKLKTKNAAHVLVFDGKKVQEAGATALLKSGERFFLSDTKFDPDADIPKGMAKRNTTGALMGVFKLCPKYKSCAISPNIFADHASSKRKLSNMTISSITGTEINGLTPKFFTSPETIAAEESVTPPRKWPGSSELMALVTADKSSIVKMIAGAETSSNTINVSFGGIKLGKGQAIYISLPESLRGKAIKSVTLTQHQHPKDNSTTIVRRYDASPAYTSVQFFALTAEATDNWRYWGGTTRYKNPKGSYFADVSVTPKENKTTDWSVMKGHDSDDVYSQEESYGAIRLLGLGTDPATLSDLTVVFQ